MGRPGSTRGVGWVRFVPVLILVGALLGACGPLGDDDEDPTATASAVPANESTAPVAASPNATPAATPPSGAAAGTPRAGVAATSAPADDDEPEATTVPDDDAETPAAEETPESNGGDDEPTEEAAEPTTVVVADCEEPDPLPERTGRQNRLVAEEGLRLRAGPGTSCDEILSLSLDTPVRVVSGVVESENDDNAWVKVELEGEEGWVAVEFLVNPPAE